MTTTKNPRNGVKKPLDHDPAKLRRRRYELGLTQQALAEAASASPTVICQMERGQRTTSAPTLARIAAALDCKPVDLMPNESVKSA